MKALITFFYLVMIVTRSTSQVNKTVIPLNSLAGVKAINVSLKIDMDQRKKSIKVIDTAQGITSEKKYAKLTNIQFHNGTIEVELKGNPLNTAFEGARGFVGIAFRIDENDTKFECIYLRPTNGRAEDQIRRNHSVQYISYPDYPWQKLRKETPEKYESYVDLEVGKWTKIKIEIQDSVAKLYVHGASQPTLIVSDLKHGADNSGSIGLWIGSGTEAQFRNLTITRKN